MIIARKEHTLDLSMDLSQSNVFLVICMFVFSWIITEQPETVSELNFHFHSYPRFRRMFNPRGHV